MIPTSPLIVALATIMELAKYIVDKCWSCIQKFLSLNLTLGFIFPAIERLQDVFNLAGVEFCTGLWDVVCGSAPPPFTWLVGLANDIPPHVWGIYVIVFQKQSEKPRIYIGSGTAVSQGARARLVSV